MDFCQGKGAFVYNSFTDVKKNIPQTLLQEGMGVWPFLSTNDANEAPRGMFPSDAHIFCRHFIHGADIQVYLAVAYLVLGQQTVVLVTESAAGRLVGE